MGTVGLTGFPGFLMGNTAEDILSRVECSVLVIQSARFVSLQWHWSKVIEKLKIRVIYMPIIIH
jgi:hypothetical protein